ncbi:hypothetical protein CI102_14914 [Trichoderma harzianum]|nr:hypothetical protein CI102_14914 [Trichoderma harzianum]
MPCADQIDWKSISHHRSRARCVCRSTVLLKSIKLKVFRRLAWLEAHLPCRLRVIGERRSFRMTSRPFTVSRHLQSTSASTTGTDGYKRLACCFLRLPTYYLVPSRPLFPKQSQLPILPMLDSIYASRHRGLAIGVRRGFRMHAYHRSTEKNFHGRH